jgi:hypothetical protein
VSAVVYSSWLLAAIILELPSLNDELLERLTPLLYLPLLSLRHRYAASHTLLDFDALQGAELLYSAAAPFLVSSLLILKDCLSVSSRNHLQICE